MGSFVSLFITQHLPSSDPPRPLKTPSKAVGSVCPGGLFFIVIYPAGVPLYAQRRLSLWETNAFFKKWRRKSKATKFQSSFSVGIVVSDGEALLSSCCLCPYLNMLISCCGWGDCGEVLALCICYGKEKIKKTSNFFSTWPAVCCIHKYGGGGASHGGGTDWAEPGETARNTCKRLVFLMQPHKSSHCSSIPSKHRSSRLKHQEVSSTGILSKFILI